MSLIKYIFFGIAVVQFASAVEINTSAQRDNFLVTGRSILVTNKEVIPIGESLAKINPFFRFKNVETSDVPRPPGVDILTGQRLLDAIAAQIKPSGTFSIAGEPILLIGKTRYRVGEKLLVKFDSKTYDLIISSIDRTNFTLKLGKFEVTRAITLNPTK